MPEIGILSAAMLGALAFGSGDMLGACASRRLNAFGAVAISQVAAVALLHVLMSGHWPALGPAETASAYAGGLAHGLALMLLYHGLAQGRVGIVAPLCAMSSIVVPLVGDLALGRLLTQAQVAGIALCVLATLLIAGSGQQGRSRRPTSWSVGIGIASGLGYGAADVVLATIPTADVMAVVSLARCSSAAFALAVAMVVIGRAGAAYGSAPKPAMIRRAGPAGVPRAALASWLPPVGVSLAIAAGLFDATGQLGYMLAATRGSMGVASAVTALFPAVTVLLAVMLFRERITTLQTVGYAVASAGVLVLVT